ncbi:hypothetical protein CBR_g51945 [Chara braunii]|uniref:Uncharacterized protein n=1 Tax=Chara braunii TaxID=69332 RepID=A0A388K6G5_CHABU|nr:hypothetical protein CBR_g51945 [Chara braunii]|eukprot:GBG65645.1 hypothetical protein CBR_g51945 [Chara braunii]
MKIRHDAEIEREKIKKEEEEKKKREQEDQERRERDRKEREEQHSLMMEGMNKKREKVCETMNGKKKEEPTHPDIEAMKKEIERLKATNQKAVASTSTSKAMIEGEELVRQLLREQELTNHKLEESIVTQRRLESLEKEMSLMRTMRDEALNEVETWKNEALLDALKNLWLTEMNARREKEQENERLKAAMAEDANIRREKELENERLKATLADLEAAQRIPCTNLRQRMDGMAARSTGKGKKKTVTDPSSSRVNEKQKYIKDMRKDLGGKKKDDIMEICLEEGLKYTTLKQSVADIIAQRVMKAFPDDGKTVHEISDDNGGGPSNEEPLAEGDAATS